MTNSRPSPQAGRRRPANARTGLKALIAASSLVVVVGGWAVIAAAPQPMGGASSGSLAAREPLPTLVPPPGALPPSALPPVAVAPARPRSGLLGGLRHVAPPLVITRSSR